jgi:hypothetical protein
LVAVVGRFDQAAEAAPHRFFLAVIAQAIGFAALAQQARAA